jgi:prepilin peptidase CpaA
MSSAIVIASEAVLIPLMFLISYYDTRYRRIPNAFVLGTLISGLAINTIYFGWAGLGNSLLGCVAAFALMLGVRFFTGLGAGDVKLFGAIGAIVGVQQVLPLFLIVVILGGLLSAFAMFRAGTARQTMLGVYGVAITCGSVLSVFGVLARG